MTLLDGKLVAKLTRQAVRREVDDLLLTHNIKLKLVVILVGDDPASQIYVRNKQRACEKAGIISETVVLDKTISQKELHSIIQEINADPTVTAILLQLPLPGHLNESRALEMIDPNKDVDGLTYYNQGKLLVDESGIIPATPQGIIALLDHYQIEISGKRALVIGRSRLVGKPAALLLLKRNATVQIAHSRTKNLDSLIKQSDIVVCAVGQHGIINGTNIKDGAIVIDVGINRVESHLVGDVDFNSVAPKCSYITPVPGGVGPMTIACLLKNVIACHKLQVRDA